MEKQISNMYRTEKHSALGWDIKLSMIMASSSVGLVCDQNVKGLNPCWEIKQPENLSVLALHCNYLF